MQTETSKAHGPQAVPGNGWCKCGERTDKFWMDAGRMWQTCINGGKWEVTKK